MQAVIMAAGEGKRMRPLTLSTPKPLLLVAGRPILEHILDALPLEIDEVIIVIGYRGDLIQKHFGHGENVLRDGRRIKYVEQVEASGTAQAVELTQPLLTGKFLLMNGDDIHGAAALAEAVQQPLALIASHHEDPTRFGVLTVDGDNNLLEIIEKPENPVSNLVSTGAMVLDERIFEYKVTNPINGEYYLTDAIHRLATDHSMKVIEQSEWIPLGYPEDIANAEQILDGRKSEADLGDLTDEPIGE
jgi:NDP-sugar pyrophosphorylase family protein